MPKSKNASFLSGELWFFILMGVSASDLGRFINSDAESGIQKNYLFHSKMPTFRSTGSLKHQLVYAYTLAFYKRSRAIKFYDFDAEATPRLLQASSFR